MSRADDAAPTGHGAFEKAISADKTVASVRRRRDDDAAAQACSISSTDIRPRFPAIVLILAILLFWGIAGSEIRCTPSTSRPDPAAGHHHRHHWRGADSDRADRRHRPLGRRHHGVELGGHGPARGSFPGCRCRSPFCQRPRWSARRLRAWINGFLVTQAEACRPSSSPSAPGASSSRSISGIRAARASAPRT